MKKAKVVILMLLVVVNSISVYAQSINTFPYSESFEIGLGDWENSTGDDFDWTRLSGSTPSANTGPTSAAHGNYYMYTDASLNLSSTALFDGIIFDFSSQSSVDMSFQYHMYGASIGALTLEVSTDDWATNTIVLTLSGDQGDLWQTANVDLSSYAGNSNVKLRFKGITGAALTSDIAIDDISISTCVTPATPINLSVVPVGLSTANSSWAAGSPAGSATVTYYWSVGTSSTHTYSSGYTVRGTTTGTSLSVTGLNCRTVYYLRIYAQTSCDGSSSSYATSSSFSTYVPSAPNSVTASPTTVCIGGTSQLNATSSGNTIKWYTAAIGGTDIGTSASGADFPVTTSAYTTYYAETESSYGCVSVIRTPIVVNVYNNFSSGEISSTDQTICYGDNPSIIGNTTVASGGDGTITYSWRSSADSYVASISGATSSTYTPPVALPVTTSYRRYAKDNTCNITPALSTGTCTVIVNPLPIISATSASSVTLCAGASSNLNATSAGYTIHWWDAATGGTDLGTSASGADYSVTPLVNTTYYAEAGASVSSNELIISEICTNADWIEVQNTSGGTWNKSGWIVAVSNNYTDINIFNSTYWNLGSFAIDQVKFKDDASGSSQYWGNNLFWNNSGKSWAMIIDDAGNVIDEVFWGWTASEIANFNATINGHLITASSFDWDSDGINPHSNDYMTRVSYNQHQNIDWVNITTETQNVENPGISNLTPSSAGCTSASRTPITVTVTPPPTVDLVSGDYVWSGGVSTDWNNSSNWLSFDGSDFAIAATVPNSTNNVYVNRYGTTCASNSATISAAIANVKNFSIDTNKSVIMSNSQVLNVSGDWTNAGSFNPGNAKVVFNGSSLQTIINGEGTFNDVTFNNSSDFNLGDTMTVNGNAIFTNGIVSYLNSSGSGGLASLDVGPQSSVYTSTSGTRGYHFIAPVDMTITSLMVPTSVGASYPQNIQVIKYDGAAPVYPATGTFTSLFYVKETTATSDPISCSIEVKAGDEIAIIGARYSGSTMYNSYGDPTYSSNIGGNTVTLTRIVYQTSLSSGEVLSGGVNCPALNLTGAIGRVEMEYILGPSGSMNFSTTASATVTSNNSFVDGKVSKTGSSAFTFPVGDVVSRDIGDGTQSYKVIGAINLQPVSSTIVSAEYCFDTTDMPDWWEHGGNMDATLDHVSGQEHWVVNSPVNLSQTSLKWYDNAHAFGSTCLHGFDEGDPSDFSSADLSVAYWDGSKWVNVNGTVTGNHDAGDITSATLIPFAASKGTASSKFITFGSKDDINPLPIELLSFKGSCENEEVLLTWKTASEINNDYFIVEKSSNLIDWEIVGSVQGAGNSNQVLDYSLIDNNNGSMYYRLTQIDYDGKYEIFPVTAVVCDEKEHESFNLYPNPTENYIYFSEAADYELLTLDGKLLKKGFAKYLNLEGLVSGVYMIRISQQYIYKVVKQ